MSDDIDIEEHDLLDDPAIKNIFPDISKLKQEILDYYSEDPELETVLNLETSVSSNTNEDNINVSTLERIPPSVSLHDCQENETPQIKKTQVQLYKNKIILGSKPNQNSNNKKEHFVKDVIPFSAKVPLEDFGYYLKNSSRYCKDCFILFPKINDFEIHKNLVHSVAIVNIKKKLEKNKCSICNALFSNHANLRRHQRNIHKFKKCQRKVGKASHKKEDVLPNQSRERKQAAVCNLKEGQSKVAKINQNKNSMPLNSNRQTEHTPAHSRECFHCKKVFTTQKALIDHIYSILQAKKTNSPTAVNKIKVKEKSNGVLLQKTQNVEVKKATKVTSDKKNKDNKKIQQINTQVNAKSTSLDGEYYRCHYCSYYFNSVKFYAAHVANKHKVLRIPKVKKVLFNPKCKYCPFTCTSIKIYNTHLHKRHPAKLIENIEVSKENRKKNLKTKTVALNTEKTDKNVTLHSSKSELYRCCYCSYYFNSVKYCTIHILNKHRVHKIPKLKNITFDPKCKYCVRTFINAKGYNNHLHKMHSKRINEVFKIRSKDQISTTNGKLSKGRQGENKVKSSQKNDSQHTEQPQVNLKSMCVKNTDISKLDIVMLKSVLFKCIKCDIHFLSIKTALDHSDHMELLINWKCPVCHKIFKRKDKVFHENQHTFSYIFTVYDITEEDIPKVLYKCSKCTIHSDVINCLTHYSKCPKKSSQSSYCNICDILVASDAKQLHEHYHSDKHWKPDDFIIIESEFMIQNEVKKHTTANVSKCSKIMFNQFYCNTCKCCISNVGMTRKVHIQSRCSHMLKYTCLNCGLVITNKSRSAHQKMHLRKKDLKLQDYKFYELKSGKQICPPIPDYHKCGICDTYFISKKSIRSHLCKNNDYLMCNICNKKFWKPNYNLHMVFHSYSMKKDTDLPYKRSSRISKTVVKKPETKLAPTIKHIKQKDATLYLYSCKNCNITVDTYEKLIEHCQKHFTNENIESVTGTCKACNLKFEQATYANHLILHEKFEKTCFENIKYDIFYFKFHNNMWLSHLFGSRPVEKIEEILKNSIYQFEHRIKMEIIQEGPTEYTMYKCAICQCFIESDIIYKHIKTSCTKIRKYECVFCGLPFISLSSRMKHENMHTNPEISQLFNFRIVLFNRPNDNEFNSKTIGSHNYYVFYQCRKCCGIVNKSQRTSHECHEMKYIECSYCGLLINESEYESHIIKHKSLDSFVSENMKVVLFGKHNLKQIERDHKSSFRGIVFDFTFRRCTNCHIAIVKNLYLNHKCPPVNSRIKCSRCNLYFYQHAYVSHIKCHENDPEFEIENMHIVEFDPPIQHNLYNTKVIKELEKTNSIESGDTSKEPNATTVETQVSLHTATENVDSEKYAKIYKCSCGLHFLDKSTITKHFEDCGKIKLSKRNCSKCGLMFTTKVLFTHLLVHHGDKNNVYKLDIEDVPKI